MQFGDAFEESVATVEPRSDAGPRPRNLDGESLATQDRSSLAFGHAPRRSNKPHRQFVASQPCLLCGRRPSDAHHLRFAQPRAMGRKVSDEYTVPLCRTHHRQVHRSGNEAEWWQAVGRDIDPLEIAKRLWDRSRRGLPPDQAEPPPENARELAPK